MAISREIQKVRLQLISPTKYDWRNVAEQITEGCRSPYEKAKAIYSWLIDNIAYDTDLRIYHADEAWQKGKGVCQAYCEIFYRLGLAVGVDVRMVSGIDKRIDGSISPDSAHSWVVVNRSDIIVRDNLMPENIIYEVGEEQKAKFWQTKGLNRQTAIIIEPTWGAGSCKAGRFYRSNHDMSWFDVEPEVFALTHFPDNMNDQLLGADALSRAEFERTPHIAPSILKYGFKADQLLAYLRNRDKSSFPTLCDGFSEFVEFEEFPLCTKLIRGQRYTFVIKKRKACVLAITNNDDFETDDAADTHWETEGNYGHINLSFSDSGKARLMIQTETRGNERIFSTIIEYDVI